MVGHHNLFAHRVNRNVRFQGMVDGNFWNSVIYQWGEDSASGEFGRLNYAGNYLNAGPSNTQQPPRSTTSTMNRTATCELSPDQPRPLHAIPVINSTSSLDPAQGCHPHHPAISAYPGLYFPDRQHRSPARKLG